jgi:hypothetical protein
MTHEERLDRRLHRGGVLAVAAQLLERVDDEYRPGHADSAEPIAHIAPQHLDELVLVRGEGRAQLVNEVR